MIKQEATTAAVEYPVRELRPVDAAAVRAILEATGWEEQHVRAAVQNAEFYAGKPEGRAAFVATVDDGANASVIGFIFVELHVWNRLAQIQGLAVHPDWRRRGRAGALVARAEAFARANHARGVYMDTPTTNLGGCAFYLASGYRAAYVMPRYYGECEDGLTFQKFLVQ